MSTKPELDPCPLCAETRIDLITPARLVLEGENYVTRGGEFHLAFAIYDNSDDTVEHNFHAGMAVVCPNCNLALPALYDETQAELVERWNERKRRRRPPRKPI